MYIINSMGRQRLCNCGEKESSEHIIGCGKTRKKLGGTIKVEWHRETEDIKKIEEVVDWLKKCIENIYK